jgi:hypothetical protein
MDYVNVDETENIRTVIVNTEFDKEDVNRYQFNLNWNLKELTEFIMA